jgi:shikimate kinase
MRIILAGTKGSGKSTIGKLLGEKLQLPVIETDVALEDLFAQQNNRRASCREICREIGEPEFRELEKQAVTKVLENRDCIICTGGQTLNDDGSREKLAKAGLLVFMKVDFNVVWTRIKANGWPAYFPEHNREEWYRQRYDKMNRLIEPVADIILDSSKLNIAQTIESIMAMLEDKTAATTENIVEK